MAEAGLLDELGREVGRVADRLRTLPEPRLREPVAGYASRSAAGRLAAQALADAAAALEGNDRRPVPELSPYAVGDQVAVTGYDLVLAARTPRAGADVQPTVRAALAELQAVRRAL